MNSTAVLRGATVILDDRPVLRAFDLCVGPGLTVIRGANGSGKTTLLRALAGLVPLARGERDVPGGVLYLGHRPQLLRGLSARDNLRFFAAFRGGSHDGTDRALASWGLDGRMAARPVETLSAGQRRRAALSRIDNEPADLVLLDEPFAELDDVATERLGTALTAAIAAGRSVVLATHGHPELDGRAVAVVRLA